MDFKLRDGESIRLMAPFADMSNHSPDVGQCHVYDPQSGNLSILAGKSYEPGDQVRLPSFLVLLVCVPLTRSALAGLHQLRTYSQQPSFTSLWLCRAR